MAERSADWLRQATSDLAHARHGLEPHVYSEDEAHRLGPTLEAMTAEGVDLLEASS